jgi:hypothetical protein
MGAGRNARSLFEKRRRGKKFNFECVVDLPGMLFCTLESACRVGN